MTDVPLVVLLVRMQARLDRCGSHVERVEAMRTMGRRRMFTLVKGERT